jgi:hypothetical protein
MVLDMSGRCQRCTGELLSDGEAYICSFECTFCPLCASDMMMFCPNCGGELLRRPRRGAGGSAQQLDDPSVHLPEQSA